jgi:hypothetical protein
MAVPLEDALRALGEVLASEGREARLVVVGGASLNLLGLIARTTADIDVIATAVTDESGAIGLAEPDPLPEWLERGIGRVARDLGLSPDWLNTQVARQWTVGLPPGILSDVEWRTYGGLDIGLVGRGGLVPLKLFAAVDRGPNDVHTQDLVALAPTDEELEQAAAWVRTQDEYEGFDRLIAQVIDHVQRNR